MNRTVNETLEHIARLSVNILACPIEFECSVFKSREDYLNNCVDLIEILARDLKKLFGRGEK